MAGFLRLRCVMGEERTLRSFTIISLDAVYSRSAAENPGEIQIGFYRRRFFLIRQIASCSRGDASQSRM